jgi:hypothetical protein
MIRVTYQLYEQDYYNIDLFVQRIKTEIARGPVLAILEPGDHTRYEFSLFRGIHDEVNINYREFAFRYTNYLTPDIMVADCQNLNFVTACVMCDLMMRVQDLVPSRFYDWINAKPIDNN